MENREDQGLPEKVQGSGREDHRLRFAFFFEKTGYAGGHARVESLQEVGLGPTESGCQKGADTLGGACFRKTGLSVSSEFDPTWQKRLQGSKSPM